MGLFPKHLQYIAYLMNELCPSIVHAVQTDFARARSFPWRSQCSSSLRSIHSTPGWLYRFSTTPDAMVVRDSPRNQDFTVIDSGHVTANLSRYSPVGAPLRLRTLEQVPIGGSVVPACLSLGLRVEVSSSPMVPNGLTRRS